MTTSHGGFCLWLSKNTLTSDDPDLQRNMMSLNENKA